MNPYYESPERDFILYKGDVCGVLSSLDSIAADMIFADPPYFLSNGGYSVQAGRCVSVNKGVWDVSRGRNEDWNFTHDWLRKCREHLAEDGTIWVCGTFHNIFTVANILSELNFRILNAVTWQKTNPPPNLSCRFFTHSTELLIWARKNRRVPHFYNYDLMHAIAGNRQMTDVWRMPAIAPWEKSCGKHPTQKPLSLVVRTILASTRKGDCVLDPFTGSSTTGIAANLCGRRFIGIDREDDYLRISCVRRDLLQTKASDWRKRIPDLTGANLTVYSKNRS